MLDPSGIWSISYRATANAVAGPDDEEIATLHLRDDGSLTGNDPFGGRYSGRYTVEGNNLSASVVVEKSYDEAITIFQNFDFPLHIELTGNYTSPDFFSANCFVEGNAILMVNCRRIADPI